MESLNALIDVARGAVTFLLVITVLVAVHELGHYWVAKLFGMKVDAFAVMVGGLRKTDLTPYLSKPMVSSKIVGAIYAATALVTFVGATSKIPILFDAGMILLATALPIWIVLRIGALYHLKTGPSLTPLIRSYIGGVLILAAATRFQGVTVVQFFSMMFAASLIGCLMAYYMPVGNRLEDDDNMGFGNIRLQSGENLPVRYRPIWHTTNREGTEFSLLALPLGGFAKIHGMHPKEDGSETQIESGFYSKSPFARLMVLFAGPVFSILLGVFLLFGTFATFGIEKPSTKPVIGSLDPKGAAGVAGMKPEDRVLTVNGQSTSTFFDIVLQVRDKADQEVKVVVERDGKPLELILKPKLSPEPTPVWGPNLEPTGEVKRQGLIGIGPKFERESLGFAQAWSESMAAPGQFVKGFSGMFKSFDSVKANVAGPATIATATANAGKSGIESVLILAAQLSITVGFMNLLPIPPLDGGQMLVAMVELLRRGKRLSMRIQQSMSTVGIFLVMMLMLFALTQDVGRGLGR